MVRLSEKVPISMSKDYFKNWQINASLQGPCHPEKVPGKTIEDESVLPNLDEKGSIVSKYQNCGKKRCKKCTEGKGHGPYKWRVTYVGMVHGKKKYRWKFIGKK